MIIIIYSLVQVCDNSSGSTPSDNESGTTGDCFWDLDGTVLTINGNGPMGNYSSSEAPWGKDITSVIIGDGVTSIGNNAFFNRSCLTSIVISDSVLSIGHGAFWGCELLSSIYIPSSVSNILGDYCFYNCNLLESIIVDENNQSFSSLDGILFNKTKTNLLLFPSNHVFVSYHIPESVNEINSLAFNRCEHIKSIVIPNSVNTIGYSTFQGCKSLTSINLPTYLQCISSDMFSGCSSLEYVIIPESLNEIKSGAFLGCSSFLSIYIPDSVKTIGDYAFYGCSSLESISLPNSITHIGDCLFYNCTSLNTVYFEGIVTSIGVRAFYGCTSLSSIDNLDHIISIGDRSFYDCSSLPSIICPDVLLIDDYAFSGCSALETTFLGESIIKIGTGAFSNCKMLESIIIPDSVVSLGEHVFYNCYGLTRAIIGDAVPLIDEYSFYECRSLESVSIGDSVKIIEKYSFYNCYSLESVSIKNNITTIGERAFSSCRSLQFINFPDSLKSIGDEAFDFCLKMISVVLGPSVESVGEGSFFGCKSLSFLSIGDAVTTIGDRAFGSCDRLKDIYIGNSVTSIGVDAFEGFRFYDTDGITELHPTATVISGSYFQRNGESDLGDYIIVKQSTSLLTESYVISWVNDDGTVLMTESIKRGKVPAFTGSIPTKCDNPPYKYQFNCWSPVLAPATENTTYYAVYLTSSNTSSSLSVECDNLDIPLESIVQIKNAALDPDYTLNIRVGSSYASFDSAAISCLSLYASNFAIKSATLDEAMGQQRVWMVNNYGAAYNISFGTMTDFGVGTINVKVPYVLEEGHIYAIYIITYSSCQKYDCVYTYENGFLSFNIDKMGMFAIKSINPPNLETEYLTPILYLTIGIVMIAVLLVIIICRKDKL